jgi:two-component system, cell cycle response regulator CpdR
MARILLADDEAGARDFVRRALEADGHTVSVCEEGSEALEALRRSAGQYDLLVTDVHMPGLDGVTLASRAMKADRTLRVLLVSGHSGGLEKAGALDAARVRTLSKPFTLDQIRAEVRSALRG